MFLMQRKIFRMRKTNIDKLNASIEQTRQKLCVMLGWKYNDTPEITEIPQVDMAQIDAMNPDTDRETALNNNYTLKINKQKLKNATADITKETLNRTIASNEQNISTDLVKSYQDVFAGRKQHTNRRSQNISWKAETWTSAERKLQDWYGKPLWITESRKMPFITKSNGVKTAELTLFQAVQTYQNAVNGLASTGG